MPNSLLIPEDGLLAQEGGDRLRRRKKDHQTLQDTRAPLPVGRQGLALAHRLPQAYGKRASRLHLKFG